MSTNKEAKAEVVKDLAERLGRAKSALVANFSGLNVAAVSEIRRELRKAGVDYLVVKNTLMRRALAGTKREKIAEIFTNTTAVAFKYDDEAAKLGKAAQALSKKFDKFQIKGGFVEDDVMVGANAVDTMASLPTLDEARAQLLGLFNAPAAKLLAQLNAPGQQIAGVIQAKVDKDEKEAAPAA